MEVFAAFLKEQNTPVPSSPDTTQPEGAAVLSNDAYCELVARVEKVLTESTASTDSISAASGIAAPNEVEATFAAIVPLAVRLIEALENNSLIWNKPYTSWKKFAIGQGKDAGHKCLVRLMQGTKGEYEIHVDNEFTCCSYHRVCSSNTIRSVQETLQTIKNDVRNGSIMPF